MNILMTSEQVSAGHPDKICDQVSDAILDACLEKDKNTRAGIECMIKGNNLFIAGELTTKAHPIVETIARNTLKPLVDNGENFLIHNYLTQQSHDIALGVDKGGAGDQGMVFGYACRDNPETLMPFPWEIATAALEALDYYREWKAPFLKQDAKAQVTFDYTNKRIDTFLISCQHTPDASVKDIEEAITENMNMVAETYYLNTDFKKLINPTGRFVLGGPYADAGLTGRKIIADTYGGFCPHGGGAFSGKDPTKIDRSAAYMARKIAKDILKEHDKAYECTVQLAYAIGVEEPVSIYVRLDNYEAKPELVKKIYREYDLTPRGIIKDLDLLNVKYQSTAVYGHFGNYLFPWEH